MASNLQWQASKPFKFIVAEKPIYMHRALVSKLSQPLNQLINCDLAESRTEEAALPGVDYDTFIRFVEWAYSGSYALSKLIPKSSESGDFETQPEIPEAPQASFQAIDLDDEFFTFSKKDKKRKAKQRPSCADGWQSWHWGNPKSTMGYDRWQSFDEMDFEVRATGHVPSNTRPNDDSNDDFTEELLSHVKLYCFAEEKDIQPLKQYSLERLKQTLLVFTITPKTTKQLVPMIRYVYENTPLRKDPKESARLLVTKYVAGTMKDLVASQEFQSLFQISDFVSDFCTELNNHLNS